SGSNGSGSNGSGSNGSGSNGSGSNGSGSNGSGSNGSGSNGSGSNGSGSNGSGSNGSGSNGSGSNGSGSNGSGSNGSGSNGSGSNGSGSNGSGSNGSGSNGSGSNGSGSNGSGSNGSGSNGSGSNGSGSNGSGSNGSGSNGSGSNGSGSNGSGSNQKNSSEDVDVDLNNGQKVKLMHNAYIYDLQGNRANRITLGAGSVITVYGIKNIAGKNYYIVVDRGANNSKYLIKVANIEARKLELKHNSYVYDKHGKRLKKAGELKKGAFIDTYGAAVTIRGQKYFIINSNQYVKAKNVAAKASSVGTSKVEAAPISTPVANTQNQDVFEKEIIHNSYLYDGEGRIANKLIILGGSVIKTTNPKMINGKLFYKLDDNLYISASNIDGKKSKLTHNAFIYSKHGNRIGKKVLKKHSQVRTYGAAVKINHKKFYLVAKNKYVKKSNF
ncbi:SLAP domain-containing protein, partial [Lactobacillus sp. B4010]